MSDVRDEEPRIVVTGLGVLSPIGIGHEAFWTALCAGTSGIRSGVLSSPGVPRLAAPLAEYAPRALVASVHMRRMDKLSRAIVSAARLGFVDARLEGRVDPARLGIVVASALGSIDEAAQYLHRLFTKGPTLASPMVFPNLVLNAPASYAAMEMGCTGANLTVSQGEVSGEHALAVGCDLIRTRRADVVIAGGGDVLADIVVAAYRRYRALSSQRSGPEWCSPYDVDRNGIVLGEGAAMVVLEAAEHARQRGASVYAEIEATSSFGVPAPLYDWPVCAPVAVEHLHQLLGGLSAMPEGAPGSTAHGSAIDLVFGAANSSRRLDACELGVLGKLFGETAGSVALTSIKGAIGEFGAAGALTAVAACMALRRACVPPLCHLRRAPADALLQLAPPRAVSRRLRRALMFSMARGGAAAALVLRQPSP